MSDNNKVDVWPTKSPVVVDTEVLVDALLSAMRGMTDDTRSEVYYYMNRHFCKHCGGSVEYQPVNLRQCSCQMEDI